MSGNFSESVVESAALAWLESLGWTVKHGPEIASGEIAAERLDFGRSSWNNGFWTHSRGSTPRCPRIEIQRDWYY
jgi:hypothetical protein